MLAQFRPRVGLCLLTILALCPVGCEQPDSQLAVRTNWYVQDLPLPKGFYRNERESTYTSGGQGRRILEVYQGGAESIRVRNFYILNMPGAGWTKADPFESLAGGVYTLNFSKGNEHCVISIHEAKGIFAQTEIRVNIESR